MRKLQLGLLVVGAGALAWMVHHLGLDTLLEGMRAVGWGFVLTCTAHLCGLLLDAVVLRACAGKPGRKVPYLHFARTMIAGHGVNAATPTGKVGEVVKYALLDEKLRAADAAGALVAQNLASFVVNCGLIALVAPISYLFLNVDRLFGVGFVIFGAAFVGAGAVGLVIMRRGLGRWPFVVMRRVGVGRFRLSRKRVDGWWDKWRKVEKSWKAATRQPGTLRTIWIMQTLSRLANVLEVGLLLYFFGLRGEDLVAGAFISLGAQQFLGWLFPFVPMQAGTAEGSAFVMFGAVGLPPEMGIMVELARKVRGVVFILLGVTVLGWDTFGRMIHGDPPKPSGDEEED